MYSIVERLCRVERSIVLVDQKPYDTILLVQHTPLK